MSTFFLHFDAKIENNFYRWHIVKNKLRIFGFCKLISSDLFSHREAKIIYLTRYNVETARTREQYFGAVEIFSTGFAIQ